MSKVSIIIPSYNHVAFLSERLQSIEQQTYTNWELIIIDDCSTDGSIAFLEDFVQKHHTKVTHFIKNDNNSGSGYTSWQKGIALAKGKYIWIAETDDFSHSDFLKESVQILEKNSQIALVFCASNYVDENSVFLYDSSNRTKDLNVPEGEHKMFSSEIFLSKMPSKIYITNGSSVLFKNPNTVLPNELFTFKQSSDQFIWAHLIKAKNVAFLNKKLNNFRRHKDSTTHILSDVKMQEAIFIEKVAFINYFKSTDINLFLNRYITFYVWQNKSALFNNTKIISELEGFPFIKVRYYLMLITLSIKKIWKRINH